MALQVAHPTVRPTTLPMLPSLDAVSELNREQLAALIGECEQLKALCWARLVSIPTATGQKTDAPPKIAG
jgi:hypothetical protein